MEKIEMDLRDHKDPEKLKLFLKTCQAEAEEDGHDKVVSITIPVSHLDPLAVLDSIYEPNEYHFYIENPSLGFALAGAEPVLIKTFDQADRFKRAKQFVEDALAHTIAIGDLDAPFSGPHFFSGFTFDSETKKNEPFAPATVYLPHWQVSHYKGRYTAVANCLIRPDVDSNPIVDRLWNAYQKFTTFDYSSAPESLNCKWVKQKDLTGKENYINQVNQALSQIEERVYEKVVLSRIEQVQFNQPIEPLKILGKLRIPYQNCYLFSFHNENQESFIGASPERLLSIKKRILYTEALAGSEPRGKNANEDADLARNLMQSEKDLREHQHVIDSIFSRLDSIGITNAKKKPVELLTLPNVQHLQTKIEAKLESGYNLFDIAEVLHPTPAVGGKPREVALKHLKELENHQRNIYTGIVGWINSEGEGEYVVALRSALIQKNKAKIYAGAGIVEGSDPEKEYKETQHKMNALLEALIG